MEVRGQLEGENVPNSCKILIWKYMYVCMHTCADDCICMEVRDQLKESVLSSVWVLGLNSGCQIVI